MSRHPSFAAACADIFRFEYVLAALPGMTITFFLCARSPRDLFAVSVLEGLLIIALLMFAALGINAVIDREIDAKYASEKKRIPRALERLGVRRALLLIAGQTALACALSFHLAWHFQSWFPIVWFAIETLFVFGYSVPPLQFKLRGVVPHGLSLLLASGIMPFALSAYTYLGRVPSSLFVFIAGFALVQYGFEFSNQALDYLEDKAEGLQTPAVRLGLIGSMKASLTIPLIGIGVAFAGLYLVIRDRLHEGMLASSSTMVSIWLVAAAIMLLGYFAPLRNTWRMYQLCRHEPPEICVPKLPALCRYASWQASSVAGVAGGCAVFFIAAYYAG
jgi:4-hydroxybenzoate polyprenyltransferase